MANVIRRTSTNSGVITNFPLDFIWTSDHVPQPDDTFVDSDGNDMTPYVETEEVITLDSDPFLQYLIIDATPGAFQYQVISGSSTPPRNYSTRTMNFGDTISPALLTDLLVTASILLTPSSMYDAEVEIQVDSGLGNGMQTIAILSEAAGSNPSTRVVAFLVPQAASYSIVSNSGTNTLTLVSEVSA